MEGHGCDKCQLINFCPGIFTTHSIVVFEVVVCLYQASSAMFKCTEQCICVTLFEKIRNDNNWIFSADIAIIQI